MNQANTDTHKTPRAPATGAKWLIPGQRVVVVQQIPQRDEVWTNRVEGVIRRVGQRKTGSWYAHAKDDKLWLDRVELRKDDGEIVILNLDRYSHVEPIAPDSPQGPEAPTQGEAGSGQPHASEPSGAAS